MSQTESSIHSLSTEGLRLTRAPLARVLTQVRWPQLGGFDVDAVAKTMSTRLAKQYPLISKSHEAALTISPEGIQQQVGNTVHQLSSVDEHWTVSLGETFLSLQTTSYVSHADFIARLTEVTNALIETSEAIPFWTRIGYRYTNRLVDQSDLERLSEYFDASVLGGLALTSRTDLVHSISESVYREGSGFLLVRSARLPSGASIDPSLPSVETESWSLDLDAYDETKQPFNSEAISDKAQYLARIAFNHFTAVITPAFIERFK
ncbi:TIGR04255 family protein [Clavibacter nebraskensis]|uniref:TIGR04255 family protein n=1 Tax=Clavibacter nebraskensis TaxID=31963 RepID=UPI001F39BEEF|nr:TIGR04255 family protein [Clavibacter nebraskensis]UKF28046.1 TIGR04255 family protein [Clavibacter nebraskensis]UQB13942.1 TIGR04255 family protein [Clavibacter nebraskensis]UQB16774.1 TIGR04255 family protein [Clavibacter nebraskensis]